MTEPLPSHDRSPAGAFASGSATGATTAGALLRAARERQGLHIVALSAQVKVPPSRLEALEADRYDELPDATFTRVLAKTLCRVLKTDPVPVLALLPGSRATGLERVDGGLNTPFHDRPGRADPAQWVPWRRPVPWAVGALLVAAAAFVLVPMRADLSPPAAVATKAPVLPPPGGDGPALAVAPAEPSAAPVVAAPLAPGASAAVPAAGTASSAAPLVAVSAAAVPDKLVDKSADNPDKAVLRAVQDTWVQAADANGQVLLARLVPAGETVEFTGALPLKVRIGNVAGTELVFRGQPVTLKLSRENVATVALP